MVIRINTEMRAAMCRLRGPCMSGVWWLNVMRVLEIRGDNRVSGKKKNNNNNN